MDWIEQWFGFAPDNGDGSLEFLLVAIGIAAVVLIAAWRIQKARSDKRGFRGQLEQPR